MRVILGLIGLLLLGAFGPALAQPASRSFTLDPAASDVRMYAFRAGQARLFGHNHVLAAPRLAGNLVLSPLGFDQSHFEVRFRLDELELDNPAHRAATGGSFAAPLPIALIESTREHMLGEFNLQAEQFPEVRIQSLQIVGEAPRFAARIALEMHGQKRESWVSLRVQGLPERLLVEGSMVVLQSDFGIKPYTVLGGLLGVEDAIVIEFRLSAADK